MNKHRMNHCKICHQPLSSPPLHVREEMYGMGEVFEYRQCPSCDCLQLMDIPADLSKYYPPGEYHNHKPQQKRAGLKQWRRALKRRLVLTHPAWLSPLFKAWLSAYPLFWIYRRLGMQPHHRVLDVGSGYGEKILEIQSAGIRKAVGVDLFIDADVRINDVAVVKKGTIDDIDETFDIIVFHHSLEHIPDQLQTLQRARSLLAAGGRVLVRIPTVTSQAYAEYREKWYQLDAPRHLYLHSHQSFDHLAQASGLKIVDRWCDSTSLQFILSEQYRRGISLFDRRSYIVNASESGFTAEQIRQFEQKTEAANRSLQGDQICFVLERR